MTIPIVSKIFPKYKKTHWNIVETRKDLLIDLPFNNNKEKLLKQVLYFLYKKNEPIFYQEICRFYEDEFIKKGK